MDICCNDEKPITLHDQLSKWCCVTKFTNLSSLLFIIKKASNLLFQRQNNGKSVQTRNQFLTHLKTQKQTLLSFSPQKSQFTCIPIWITRTHTRQNPIPTLSNVTKRQRKKHCNVNNSIPMMMGDWLPRTAHSILFVYLLCNPLLFILLQSSFLSVTMKLEFISRNTFSYFFSYVKKTYTASSLELLNIKINTSCRESWSPFLPRLISEHNFVTKTCGFMFFRLKDWDYAWSIRHSKS